MRADALGARVLDGHWLLVLVVPVQARTHDHRRCRNSRTVIMGRDRGNFVAAAGTTDVTRPGP